MILCNLRVFQTNNINDTIEVMLLKGKNVTDSTLYILYIIL